MEQTYQVIYQGRLRGGQTRSGVAGRLSEALGRERAELEALLAGPARIILATPSERDAQRLAEIFAQAGAEVRMQNSAAAEDEAESATVATGTRQAKPSMPPTFGQRVWLLRAAAVLSFLVLLAGTGLSVLVGSWVALLLSYDRLLNLVPYPVVVLPLYLATLLFLLLVIAALVKPFVRFTPRLHCAIKLERANERHLFDFVSHVCEVIRVPYPRAIHVDMSGTVTAGMSPGSELTMGLPVIASASTAHLGSMIARALTLHISGSSGRLGRFVVTVTQGLHHAVHERDRFDHALETAATGTNPLMGGGARLLRRSLGISRRLSGYFLKEATGTSAAAMQAIEAHRDRHHARIVGSQRFEQGLRQMRLLQFAVARTNEALREAAQQGRALPPDLASVVVQRLSSLAKPELLSKVLTFAEREQEPVTLFHTPDTQRIERIRKSGIEFTTACATPARQLLRSFPLLARRLTLLHYRNTLMLPVEPLELAVRSGGELNTLDAFTGNVYLNLVPLSPRRFQPTGTQASSLTSAARELLARLPEANRQARRSLAHYRETEKALGKALIQELELRAGRLTRQARDELETVQTRCRALEMSLERAYDELKRYSDLVARRLSNGIALLGCSETAQRLPNAPALAARAAGLLEALDKIQLQTNSMRELHMHLGLLEVLLAGPEGQAELKSLISEEEAEIATHLTALRVAMKQIRHPLQEQARSVFDHVRAGWTPTNPRYAALDESAAILEGVLTLKGQIVAQLATMAAAAEKMWGLNVNLAGTKTTTPA